MLSKLTSNDILVVECAFIGAFNYKFGSKSKDEYATVIVEAARSTLVAFIRKAMTRGVLANDELLKIFDFVFSDDRLATLVTSAASVFVDYINEIFSQRPYTPDVLSIFHMRSI
jgi:hypothetical protein